MKFALLFILKRLLYLPIKFLRKFVYRGKFVVFLWHDVTQTPHHFSKSKGIWCGVGTFEWQLRYLIKNFNFIDPWSLIHESNQPLYPSENKPMALITFDDAWLSIVDSVAKVNDLGLVSIVFINGESCLSGVDSNVMRQYENWNDGKLTFNEFQGPLLSPLNLEELCEERQYLLASHLYRHDRATSLSGDRFDELLKLNHEFCKRFKNYSHEFFAFPHGAFKSDFTIDHVQKVKSTIGSQFVFGADLGVNILNREETQVINRIHLTEEVRVKSEMEYLLLRAWFFGLKIR